MIDRVNISTTIADAITAFEWIADPDGDPGTVDDVPDVCSNSRTEIFSDRSSTVILFRSARTGS